MTVPPFGSLLSSVARLIAAVAVLAIGLVGSAFVLFAAGRPSGIAAAVALAILFLAFLAFRVANRPSAPLRAYRLSLAIGLFVAGYLLSALPWPLQRSDLPTAAVLGAGVLVSLTAILLATRAPRVALALAAALAVYGAVMAVNFARRLASVYIGSWSPAVVLSYLIALCMGISWLAGLVQLLWTQRRTRAADRVPAT